MVRRSWLGPSRAHMPHRAFHSQVAGKNQHQDLPFDHMCYGVWVPHVHTQKRIPFDS